MNTIERIKVLRLKTGCSLVEAKKQVLTEEYREDGATGTDQEILDRHNANILKALEEVERLGGFDNA